MKEEQFINLLRKKFKVPKNIIGIGDDTAVLPFNNRHYLLFTTDTILDGVHFKFKEVNPMDIGHKAIAVNISDIAAMGGLPLYTVINLGLPKYDLRLVNEIYWGIKRTSQEFKIKVVGGDTVKSKIFFLAVAMIGKVERKCLVLRNGAKTRNLICVTGEIGGSLKTGKHLKFKPRLKEARLIVKKLKPSAMIDISDGLILDLFRMCQESNKGAILFKEKIPISNEADDFETAVTEGEDFELLFTVGEKKTKFIKKISNTKISIIGEITKKRGIFIKDDNKLKPALIKGYNHFD